MMSRASLMAFAVCLPLGVAGLGHNRCRGFRGQAGQVVDVAFLDRNSCSDRQGGNHLSGIHDLPSA